ncbi:phospholipase D2-like [Dysidea avara]|uniref:phospholipase D2-like n=1 Tax=Dysidea avara TaxID=196820 RepID=UPI00331EEA2D
MARLVETDDNNITTQPIAPLLPPVPPPTIVVTSDDTVDEGILAKIKRHGRFVSFKRLFSHSHHSDEKVPLQSPSNPPTPVVESRATRKVSITRRPSMDELDELFLDPLPKVTIASLTGDSVTMDTEIDPYLENVPIKAEVLSVERLQWTQPFNPNVYTIQVKHGCFIWVIRKTYRAFCTLKEDIRHWRNENSIPQRERQTSIDHRSTSLSPIRHKFSFIRRQRSFKVHTTLQELDNEDVLTLSRKEIRDGQHLTKLTQFLNAILEHPILKKHPATLHFLEVSRLTFVEDLGMKMREGEVNKRSGGYRYVPSCFGGGVFTNFKFSVWRNRWLVLKESFLAYVCPETNSVAGVLLFDETLQIQTGVRQTGSRHGVKISNQEREFMLSCSSHRKMTEWKIAILKAMAGPGRVWIEKKQFGSFAPVREACQAAWFVDGQHYMSSLADTMESAVDEIFITDWAFSPFVFLKRPCKDKGCYWRLDQILYRKAVQGVKVYILIYKELELVLNLGSAFAKDYLNNMHPNIMVLRHPDHLSEGILLWAHHEKIVVIDQTVAYVGGMDLTFGRWDTWDHHLTDVGMSPLGPFDNPLLSNSRRGSMTSLFGGTSSSSMIALSSTLADTLVQMTAVTRVDCGENYQMWIGKDYYNTFIRGLDNSEEPFTDHLNRAHEHRMPWHDIAVCLYGQPARDVARHFIQRFNFTKLSKRKTNSIYPYLLPRREFTDDEIPTADYLHRPAAISSNCKCQVLRSAGDWSAGIGTKDDSILRAMLHAIDFSEHFIYMEVQFFISNLPEHGVFNTVAEALRKRIARAYANNETFRVYLVITLLPEVGGVLGEDSGAPLEALLHWEYCSLFKGRGSLMERLVREDGIPEDQLWEYISLCGLRTHEKLNETRITEILYVHSKLMIVDDKITIVGSANINDRSLQGNKDSEVSVIIEDVDMVTCPINGQPIQVGRFAHSLRTHLFREHLGLLDNSEGEKTVEDPVIRHFYEGTWMNTAVRNTRRLQRVFGGKCIPTDDVRTFAELVVYRKETGTMETDEKETEKLLEGVKGHLVTFPTHFLEGEQLRNTIRPLPSEVFY